MIKTNKTIKSDDYYMDIAIEQAKKASKKQEVPVGCVIVNNNGKILAKAYNKREKYQNVIAHAEILALNMACKKVKSWRLEECKIYITLQPCPMCASAIEQARIKEVIYGTKIKNNLYSENSEKILNKIDVRKYVRKQECSLLLTSFFQTKRIK